MAIVSRRKAIAGIGAGGAIGLGLLAFTDQGRTLWRTPEEARKAGLGFKTLDAGEVATLEALGETLLPGAREAGIAHYVDHHLAQPSVDSLLMIRYLDIPPPYLNFYRAGLAALNGFASAKNGKIFGDQDAGNATDIVRAISSPDPAAAPKDWRGPPASIFYFVTRADAVDVVYGTEKGTEKLGLPYMAHILPETPW